MTQTERPTAWMSGGACRGLELEVFFVDDEAAEPSASVFAICDHCPVKARCLDWALTNRVSHGVWGGTTPKQRRKLLVRKTRVRCPGCSSTLVNEMSRSEVCLACGLTWLA